MEYIYTMEYYSATKRMSNAIFGNIDAPRDYHIKWSKSDGERQVWYHLFVESKKGIQINLFMKQKQIHRNI